MAEKKKYNYCKELTKGFLRENPVLRLVLGTCPTLATSTSVVNGLGMGIAATIVLVCSNIAISALRKVIPSKARIPAYIVIIASFVTMVQMLVKAFPRTGRITRRIPPAHRRKLHYPRQSRSVCGQKSRTRFRGRRSRHGHRLYSRAVLHGHCKRNSRSRHIPHGT